MSKIRAQREIRCEEANKVIMAIAQHGRRCFFDKNTGRIARLYVDSRCRIWYVDEYTGACVYTHQMGNWRGFTGGGTLLRLVKALKGYIMTGVPIAPTYFGPWPLDVWSYGLDEMQQVWMKVFQTLAVRRPGGASE
jgi:hypothetical protein